MPRKPKAPTILSLQQTALFAIAEEPEMLAIAKHWQHNAATTLRDERRCYEVCVMLAAGVPVMHVATRVFPPMSPKTVRAIRRELAVGGKLAHLKERLVRDIEEFAVDALHHTHECLPEMTGTEASVAAGIWLDKRRDLEGLPGLVVEHRHQVVLNVDRVNEMLAGTLAPEIASGDQAALSAAIDVVASVGPCVGPSAGTGPASGPTGADQAEGGGGGRVSEPGAAEADVCPSGELPPKEFSDE